MPVSAIQARSVFFNGCMNRAAFFSTCKLSIDISGNNSQAATFNSSICKSQNNSTL